MPKSDQIDKLCLYGIILSYPFSVRLCNTCILILGVNALFRMGKFQVSRVGTTVMLMLPFLLSIISMIYTENTKEGWRLLEKGIPFVVFPLAFSTMKRLSRDQLEKLFDFSAITLAGALLVYLLNATPKFLQTHDPGVFAWKNLTDPFSFHPSYLSVYIIFVLAGIFFSGSLRAIRNSKTITVAIVLVLFLSLLLLGAKLQIAFLCLMIVVFGGIVIWRKRTVYISITGCLVIIAIIFFVVESPIIKERFSHIESLSYSLNDPAETFNELTIRLALAECSMKVFAMHPVFGVGVGDVDDELLRIYYSSDYKFGYLDRQNPHNQYLSTLLACGIFGLAALLGVLGYGIFLSCQHKQWHFLFFIILISLSFVFESMLERQKGIVFFSFVLSLFVFHVIPVHMKFQTLYPNDDHHLSN